MLHNTPLQANWILIKVQLEAEMAQQVQLVFKTALKATQGGGAVTSIGRSMSTGALGTIDGELKSG